jgi:hypothetical protein
MARAVTGRVAYEARQPTTSGASAAREVRPARFVSLEVLDASGRTLTSGATDADGRFELAALPGAAQLVVWARVSNSDHDVAVTLDIQGTQTHRLDVPIAGDLSAPLDIVATDGAEGGPAGAFHILDTMLVGLEAAERWTGRQMPPVFVYWGRGITTSWSYYRGEQPAGSGRYALELMGGDPGQQHTTDTDEHDEAIMLHELGHLVMDLISTSSSLAGRHPPGVLVDPGLAWEEAKVSWFAVAARNDPLYQDTIGVEPIGRLRVDRDYSRVNPGPRGIGSEQTAGEVLWDLADGAGGIEDRNDDGVALGPDGVMAALVAMSRVDGSWPCVSSFLRFLIDSGRVGELDLKAMLQRTGQPEDLLPLPGAASWPEDLSLGSVASGAIDGLSDPAPSGGPAHPSTGFDSTRAYRFRLQSPAPIEVRLDISGSGAPADHQDLDLELRSTAGELIGTSRGTGADERILTPPLPAGWYIVHVRDAGNGNRARFGLVVSSR